VRPWLALSVGALIAACAGPTRQPAPARAPDFRPTEVRQPALVVRVTLASGRFSDREREVLPATYEGALLDGLDAGAVVPRDLQRVENGALEPSAAVARARAIGADHAMLVDVEVTRGEPIFCRQGRRPFRASATTWTQTLTVLRASDSAPRLALGGSALVATDLEPDCDDPRRSRRRSAQETAVEAVSRLLTPLLGSSGPGGGSPAPDGPRRQ
jgi:hypothetical protein